MTEGGPGAAAIGLQARGLRLRVGGRWLLDGLDLDLPRGQWAALVGPNGAGKSSLLAVLAGVRRPEAGTVAVDPPRPGPVRPRDRAWLAQGSEADGDIAVRDVVRLGRLPHHGLFGAPGAADEAVVDAVLAEVGVGALAQRRLRELSGGERQRVLLARALAVEAGVLLLDEPSAHLDAPHQRGLLRSVRARAARGAAVLTVLHDLTQALMADRVLVLVDGRLVADGPPGDPALQRRLEAAFDHAVTIAPLPGAVPRWVAVPVP